MRCYLPADCQQASWVGAGCGETVPRCNGSLVSRVADRFSLFVVVRTLLGTCGWSGPGREQEPWQVPVGVLLKSRARGPIALVPSVEYNNYDTTTRMVLPHAGAATPACGVSILAIPLRFCENLLTSNQKPSLSNS